MHLVLQNFYIHRGDGYSLNSVPKSGIFDRMNGVSDLSEGLTASTL